MRIEVLHNEVRRAARSARYPALLMFDLDDFKGVNDRHGHLHGDAILQAVARTIDGLLRGSDVKCRYGGDEFLVILPETGIAGAAQVAEHIRQGIRSAELARADGRRARDVQYRRDGRVRRRAGTRAPDRESGRRVVSGESGRTR